MYEFQAMPLGEIECLHVSNSKPFPFQFRSLLKDLLRDGKTPLDESLLQGSPCQIEARPFAFTYSKRTSNKSVSPKNNG